MPAVKMMQEMYEKYASDPSTPAGKIDAALKNPEVRKILDLLAQMGSEEVFVYGGDDFNNTLELVQDVASKLRYGPTVLQMTGQANGRTPSELQARLAMSCPGGKPRPARRPHHGFGLQVEEHRPGKRRANQT